MGSSPWAFVSRRGMVLFLLIPTAMILLSATSITNAEIIYKPGDWLLYRYTFNYDGWECTYLYRVTVRNIKETNVLYSESFEKMEKGDDPLICRNSNLYAMLPVRVEVPRTSDISREKPGSLHHFINPAYTGEYKIDEITYRYYKGILIERRREITESGLIRIELVDTSIQKLKALITPSGVSVEQGSGLTRTDVSAGQSSGLTRTELVDTSIQEPKALITPSGVSITMNGLILVVLATIITVIVIFIVVRRRHKTTETPLNQSQVA